MGNGILYCMYICICKCIDVSARVWSFQLNLSPCLTDDKNIYTIYQREEVINRYLEVTTQLSSIFIFFQKENRNKSSHFVVFYTTLNMM